MRDQIIVGTRNNEIRKNTLKNQWNLPDLVLHGHQLEATEQGAVKIVANKRESNQGELYRVARNNKPGHYSRKYKISNKTEGNHVQQFRNKKCETYFSCTSPEETFLWFTKM